MKPLGKTIGINISSLVKASRNSLGSSFFSWRFSDFGFSSIFGATIRSKISRTIGEFCTDGTAQTCRNFKAHDDRRRVRRIEIRIALQFVKFIKEEKRKSFSFDVELRSRFSAISMRRTDGSSIEIRAIRWKGFLDILVVRFESTSHELFSSSFSRFVKNSIKLEQCSPIVGLNTIFFRSIFNGNRTSISTGGRCNESQRNPLLKSFCFCLSTFERAKDRQTLKFDPDRTRPLSKCSFVISRCSREILSAWSSRFSRSFRIGSNLNLSTVLFRVCLLFREIFGQIRRSITV